MKKILIFGVFMMLSVIANAQSIRFGYFSYNKVLHAMEDYHIATQNLEQVKKQYEAELQRSENDFHAKYEDFLEGQKDFAPSILRKRQAELQEIIHNNKQFAEEAQRLLKQAEENAYTPIRKRLDEAVKAIGKEKGYAFVLNTDSNTLPYIDPLMGEDITEMLKNELKLK